jgi:hypothetical protein
MIVSVRRTMTLDPDTHALLAQLMREQGMSLEVAVNHAIRVGLAGGEQRAFPMTTRQMGQPAVSVDQALRRAGELEDDQLIERLAVRE